MTDPLRTQILHVPREARGERLDRFLARELALRPERARALVESGRVRVRGKLASPLRKLFGGEELHLLPPPAPAAPGGAPGPEAPRPDDLVLPPVDAAPPALPLLYADADVLVVDKPADLPVEPAGPRSPSVVTAAAARLGPFDVDGGARPGLPHRLDRDTTGCLLLARHDRALAALKRAFAAGEVEKRYLALVGGRPPDQGHLDTPYGRDPEDPRRFTTRFPSPRRARLGFTVHRRLPGCALVEVALETGRTHQIRVQLAEAGWPVLGDLVYGVRSSLVARQALHATRLAFPAPSGQRVEVEAPLPADLEAALARLG